MTLVELVVVMGVIAIIAGLSVPALTSYAKQVRLKTAARQVVGLVSLARSLAISAHEAYAVVIDPGAQTISVVQSSSGEALEQAVRVPKGVTVSLEIGGASSSATELVFQPTGALSGRTTTILLAEGIRQHRITVTGATGAITVN